MSAADSTNDGRPHTNSQVGSIVITNKGRVPNTHVYRSNAPFDPWELPAGKSVTITLSGQYHVRDATEKNYFFITYDSANAVLYKQDILAPGAFEVIFYLNGSGEGGYGVSDRLPSTVVNKLDSYITPPHVNSQVNTLVIENIGNSKKTEVARGDQAWQLPKGKKLTLQDPGLYYVRHYIGQPYFYVNFDLVNVTIGKLDIPSPGAFSVTCTLSATHTG